MLWMLFLITFSLAIFQEMCAQMGAVTGKGLSDLIREEFGVRLTLLAMLTLLVANISTTIAEFAGIAASCEILGITKFSSVPTIGTTITPWMQFFLQSTVVDKGITTKHYKYTKWDVLLGAFITDFVAFFIIVACGATLFKYGIKIETAKDAAMALAPIAGRNCELLFAAGLFGASMLAASILPLSTSYAICEAFGLESGLNKRWKEAPVFFGLYTFLIVIGSGAILIPNISLMRVMLLSQTVNGVLLPIILIFILRLANNQELMGAHTNSRTYNLVAWATAIIIIFLTLLLLLSSLIG